MKSITETERKFLELIRKADAVFIFEDDGCKIFSWIRGFSDTPASVQVKYGQGSDKKRAPRHLTVRMGVSEREFNGAIARAKELPSMEVGTKTRSIRCAKVGCRKQWVCEVKDGPVLLRLCETHAKELRDIQLGTAKQEGKT